VSARRTGLVLAASLLLGCSSSKPVARTQTPAPPAASAKASGASSAGTAASTPPPPGLSPEAPFPSIVHQKLENGLGLRLIERRDLPVVEVSLVVFSGQATDTDKPGLAAVAGELLKAGGAGAWSSRDLLEEAEALGGQLQVLTDRDSTSVSMAVSARDFARALEIVAAVAQKPRLAANEFTKLRQREIERVTSLSRTSPGWVASMTLYRELYRLPTGVHPYAQYDATPASLGKLTLADCRSWHKQHFVPKNATLVVVGQVTPAETKAAAERVLGRWQGEAPPKPDFATPLPPDRTSVYVVNRPRSPQAQIYVSTLGPERSSPDWAALRTTNQILGGGVSGRLFLDVREQRSLAYSTSSSVEEVAHGPVPISLSAGTQTAKAGLAVAALLEHVKLISERAPSAEEVATATRYLSDSFLIAMETTGALASMTRRLAVYRLPDDYYDDYRAKVRAVQSAEVKRVAARYFRPGSGVIVVAGDAERLTRPLSRFAAVHVVEPERGFGVDRVVPHDPSAPLTERAEPSR
jgi:predicted Zn-dependent peptidase